MSWLEQKIRRYEHSRWAAEPDRRQLPFGWGLEYIGGRAGEPEPRQFLNEFVDETLAGSEEWLTVEPVDDYRLADGVLMFTSAITSPWPENNRVHAQFFPAKQSGPAVVVLAQWNARWHEQTDVCRWLNKLGITALKMSLPYHDRRAIPGHPRADYMVGPNIGLTIQANRQAVCDAIGCVRWLGKRGYSKVGVLGTSVGSSVAFVAMAHERAIRAGAFLHVATYVGDVTSTGLTTAHVWDVLRTKVTPDELRRFWSPVSPFPYVARLRGTGQKCLAISGRYDPTFWREFSQCFFDAVRSDGVPCEILDLPCGHYSLGEAPFKWAAGYRFGTFLFQSLT